MAVVGYICLKARHLFRERWHLLKDCGEHVEGGDLGEGKVLARPLLQLGVGGPEIGVRQEDLLHVVLDLGEQVDKLDIGRQQEGPRHRAAEKVDPRKCNLCQLKTPPAEMVFAVQELQLDSRTAALVARNQVAELAENVTTNLVSICFNAATNIGQS